MRFASVLEHLRWVRLPDAGAGRALLVTAGVLAIAGPLMSCDDGGWWWRHNRLIGGACPRPNYAVPGETPQFGAQQIEVRAMRERAFRGDFFAQLELARRYEGGKSTDKNLTDPVEAAVWYGMALSNESGYAPIASHAQGQWTDRLAAVAHFDDCRAWERGEAYHNLDRLLSRMSTDERDQVRDRMIYVLSTMGADGYRTLARLHDLSFGPFGEPLDNGQGLWARGPVSDRAGAPATLGMFQRNDVDAYIYNYLAAQTGDVGAYVLLKDFERGSGRADYANFVQAKADRWTPPFEFYPPEAPASGVPHSDESKPISEAADLALARIRELPFSRVADALVYLKIIPKICDEEVVTHDAVRVLQAMLGRPQTGYFTATEKVRAIQYAATNGSSKSQLTLAVMYAEGIGVQTDYARAFHWFAEADKQGSGEAKFAMSQFFSQGLQGIADQDKAKSVVYQIDSALSGFHPSADKLMGILQRMNRFGRAGYGGPPPGVIGPIYRSPPYGPPGTSPPGGYGPPIQGPSQRGYIAPAAYGPPPYSNPSHGYTPAPYSR